MQSTGLVSKMKQIMLINFRMHMHGVSKKVQTLKCNVIRKLQQFDMLEIAKFPLPKFTIEMNNINDPHDRNLVANFLM